MGPAAADGVLPVTDPPRNGANDVARAHVVISGRVQGVFFRHETSRRARSRGVKGWVRNLPDGRVEAVFEGARDSVESLIGWCRAGPSMAEVSSVEVEWQEPKRESSFSVH
jgi:acylphosphatase